MKKSIYAYTKNEKFNRVYALRKQIYYDFQCGEMSKKVYNHQLIRVNKLLFYFA